MRLDRKKIDIILARKCMSMSALKKYHFNGNTLASAITRQEPCGTRTAGKIAQALGVDIMEILLDDEGDAKQ